jgi:hypothetical protein
MLRLFAFCSHVVKHHSSLGSRGLHQSTVGFAQIAAIRLGGMVPIDRLGGCLPAPRVQRFGFHGLASILMEVIDSSLM